MQPVLQYVASLFARRRREGLKVRLGQIDDRSAKTLHLAVSCSGATSGFSTLGTYQLTKPDEDYPLPPSTKARWIKVTIDQRGPSTRLYDLAASAMHGRIRHFKRPRQQDIDSYAQFDWLAALDDFRHWLIRDCVTDPFSATVVMGQHSIRASIRFEEDIVLLTETKHTCSLLKPTSPTRPASRPYAGALA